MITIPPNMAGPAAAAPGQIVRQRAHVDECTIRQLALQHAVTTHGPSVDESEVVTAAEAYLAFLTGQPADDSKAG